MGKVKTAAIALLVGAATAGCYGAYELDCVDYVGPVPIEEEPPPPREEEIPPPPYEDAVWIDGHWSWSGVRYVWVPGHYAQSPGPGCYWYPGGYVRKGRHYVYIPGRWGPRQYRPRYRYVYPRRYPPQYDDHDRGDPRRRPGGSPPAPRRRAPPVPGGTP